MLSKEEIINKINELIKHKNDYDIAFGCRIYHPYAMSKEDYEPIERFIRFI